MGTTTINSLPAHALASSPKATVGVRSSLNNLFLRAAHGITERSVVQNYTEYASPGATSRALLSYIVWPLLPPPRFRDKILFSNRGIAQELPRALNELGYVVDIIHFKNVEWRPRAKYDLFVGHAGVNFRQVSDRLPDDTTRIYFATGLYWKDANRREATRIWEFARKTGWVLPPDRAVVDDEEYANRRADGIVYLGNKEAGNSFRQFNNIAGVNNATFPIHWDSWRQKDFDAGRKHFLFFSGRGNLHKGLDRIIEAFVETDLHLHVCQHIEAQFARVFRKELHSNPRIHLYDFVPQRSAQFYDLAMTCNWFVSATCAEGQPGAALETMGHGLIPIMPAEANIDIGQWGITLPDCNVATIRRVAIEASGLSVEACKDMAGGASSEVKDVYTVERFRDGAKRAILDVLERRGVVPGFTRKSEILEAG